TGASTVFGNVGVSPDSSITGFGPGVIVGGSMHLNDAMAQNAQSNLAAAYNVIAGESFTSAQNLTGQDLGNRTLFPGVYHFDTSAQLTGSLVLDALGDPNARFDFQIGSALTTASAASVSVINGGTGGNVYWQVGSSATLGTGTVFTGNILALTSITLNPDASIVDGRALARNGAVTLDANRIGAAVVPEANTAILLALALPATGVALVARRKKK
ncbi:MAG: DUF3494 domain-containing protein, partial [Cytophagaceae bacterium]